MPHEESEIKTEISGFIFHSALPCRISCKFALKCGKFLTNDYCNTAIQRYANKQEQRHNLAPEHTATPKNENEVWLNFGKYYGQPKKVITIPGERRIIRSGTVFKPNT